MPDSPHLDCGICLLRPLRDGDQASLARHANDREVWLNLRDRFPHPYTTEDAEAWIRHTAAMEPVTSLAIDVGGELVGTIAFTLHSDIERVSAEVGYWLGREYWNRGILSAALRLATLHAFRTFKLTRVFAVPFVRNVPSHRVLEKAGFRLEGTLRRSAMKEGVVLDQRMYAITDLDLEAPPR